MFSFKNIVEFLLDKHLVLLSVCVALCCTYCAGDVDESDRCTFMGETVVGSSEAFSCFHHILDVNNYPFNF